MEFKKGKAVIGTFYKTYQEALKNLKKGYEILPCSNGYLIINSKYARPRNTIEEPNPRLSEI